MEEVAKKCPTCGQYPERTKEQNKLYWAVLREISERLWVAEDERFPKIKKKLSVDTWHLFMKKHFLGSMEIKLPYGEGLIIVPVSTADKSQVNKVKFSDYLDQVQAWAAERGVYLADREGT